MTATDGPVAVRADAGGPGAACRFSHAAMGTTFEILTAGQDARYAGQAASAAFDELDRLEGQLSRFIETSDIAQLNAAPAGGAVRLGPAAFECLQQARQVHDATGGAFDVTVGPLLACWRAADGSPRRPGARELADALARVGMDRLRIDRADHAVTAAVEGMCVDLGGIGKGYALDQMAELLGEWSLDAALLACGSSTALAVGPPAGTGWRVEMSGAGALWLRDRALSGSGVRLRAGHIVDPRTARPAQGRTHAWAVAPRAAAADALSTAFMVMSADEVESACGRDAGISAMLAGPGGSEGGVVRFGRWEQWAGPQDRPAAGGFH